MHLMQPVKAYNFLVVWNYYAITDDAVFLFSARTLPIWRD